ncbi:DoxX family protein [Steroidobacter sp. S1-65]|uniref:DoxX family protein n=1 Tax=Steroidobacter gossypii TaxID=2805490 RepID=A0ABS1X5Q2_9GAMM|nr:DoxX family protein [Steroidobacter gossypii]
MHRLALLLLCAAYLQGGFTKLIDFEGALAEMHHFGLTPALPFAVATIALELAASAAIVIGFYRWLAALALAAFTLAATLIANRFWEAAPVEQFAMTNSFFEHLGLVGAFLLVAWYDLGAATPADAAPSPEPHRRDHR